MYSPVGLVIFVAVEGTFVRFTKGHHHFILNAIRCGCLQNDQFNIACQLTNEVNYNLQISVHADVITRLHLWKVPPVIARTGVTSAVGLGPLLASLLGGVDGGRSSPVSSEAWTGGRSSLRGGVIDRRRFIGGGVRGGRHLG